MWEGREDEGACGRRAEMTKRDYKMISRELLDSAALKDFNPWTFETNEPGDASFYAVLFEPIGVGFMFLELKVS